jgi:GNAT superfamily N-acetyltransferase
VSWTIRPVVMEDIPDLVDLRREMFEAMGWTDSAALDRMSAASTEYFHEHVPTGAFRAWIAEAEGRPIAAIGLVVHSIPPSPDRVVGKEAYIMNLVTLPEHRRRGIAGALLGRVIEACRREGIPIASLHATEAGRGIYKRLGFAVDDHLPEMRLDVSDTSGRS